MSDQIENGVEATLESLADEFKTDGYQERTWNNLWDSEEKRAKEHGDKFVRPEYPGNPHKKPSTTV
ncbi:hypothetical protein MUP56_01485 [Patescibacteria group bacterium]|nr:hypothetical protein [Patescibacteria group bacterium]